MSTKRDEALARLGAELRDALANGIGYNEAHFLAALDAYLDARATEADANGMYYCAARGHEQTEPCPDCASQDAGPDVFLTWEWETMGPRRRKGILSASVVDPHDGGTSEHYIPAARAAMRAELEEMRGPRDQWGRMRAERDAANARALAAEQRLVDMAEVPCTNEWAGIGLAKALACTEADRCSFCRVRALRGGGSP